MWSHLHFINTASSIFSDLEVYKFDLYKNNSIVDNLWVLTTN